MLFRRMQYDQLDQKRDQHHLASLLCAIAAEQGDHDLAEARHHLDSIAKNRFDRKLRLAHAVALASRTVPASLAGKVKSLGDELA